MTGFATQSKPEVIWKWTKNCCAVLNFSNAAEKNKRKGCFKVQSKFTQLIKQTTRSFRDNRYYVRKQHGRNHGNQFVLNNSGTKKHNRSTSHVTIDVVGILLLE